MDVKPVTLTGKTLRVEPLSVDHAPDLFSLADPDLFALLTAHPREWTLEAFREHISHLLSLPGQYPFAMVLLGEERAVGYTSYFDVRPQHRGLEIGYTLITRPYQGTQVNPENKYLLLRHAFETLGAVRVQLKTDLRNLHSQRAMEKLGAKREGVLRKHIILPDGYVRDTVMFSIVDEEWPEVKKALETRLGYVP